MNTRPFGKAPNMKELKGLGRVVTMQRTENIKNKPKPIINIVKQNRKQDAIKRSNQRIRVSLKYIVVETLKHSEKFWKMKLPKICHRV